MLELILELLFHLVWDVLMEVVPELVIESVVESFRPRERGHPVAAALGLLVLGGAIGLVWSLLWPERILQWTGVRGISLLLSPLVSGAAMYGFGRWRAARGRRTSYLATY